MGKDNKQGQKKHQRKEIKVSIPGRDVLLLNLDVIIEKLKTTKSQGGKQYTEALQFITEARDYLNKHLGALTVDVKGKTGGNITYQVRTEENATEDEIQEVERTVFKYLNSGQLKAIIGMLIGLDSSGVEEPAGTFIASGYLNDQTLHPGKLFERQLSLFDQPAISKNVVKRSKPVRDEIIEGIPLTPSQKKLVDSLCKILHERSQNTDPDRNDYYAGAGTQMREYLNSGEREVIPELYVTMYDLAKEYSAKDKVSGKDIKNVSRILKELSSKKFKLTYEEETEITTKGNRKKKDIKQIEALRHILHIDKAIHTIVDSENGVEEYRDEKFLIMLNPIFKRHIYQKFVKYPKDINKRTIKAYGSRKISSCAISLRDYLARSVSAGTLKPEIGYIKALRQFDYKSIKSNRKKKAKENLEKAIKMCENLNLIKSYKIVPAKGGGDKIVFELNKEWAEQLRT